ncbi:TIGR03986 family type III CRISPR-associated RAMP protein [Prevotella falsenii]|uniref:TIGR03986 family type III CRISPR-associated RAMP protein n=1 Tax=Prevotella falsenii TaxID=515414 RepID=UPI000564070C|nr:TIGR03986 family CRISPR-associated RAMP protein [Prevotella falsenii]
MGKQSQVHLTEEFYNPYSFVPVIDHVFNYSKEEKERFMFANDIPFSNGISGKIIATFKAETPFCVKSQDKENCNIANKYFVPSTSIKGMVRSVFDIITLSNLKCLSENSRFSMRDLKSDDYELKNKEPKSGFLILLKGKYYVIPCYNWKVSYEDIKKEEGVDVSKGTSAEAKYKMLKKGYVFPTEDNLYHYWFFSGFMSNKKHEYDFALPASINENGIIPLRDKEFKEFRFIHEKENKNESWAFWKREMRNFNSWDELKANGYKGLAPCFYRSEKDESEALFVKDLGFSFLYRMPYQKNIHDCLPKAHKENSFDMSQALFGYVGSRDNRQQGESLRGRVRFSNAFIMNAEREGEQTFILGSPKPTYYPFYLQQERGKELKTLASDNPVISGWKRYLIQNNAKKGNNNKVKSASSFIPLKAGAGFTTEIHVHNLLPHEVGALLAALTFCNHKECYHSLGYAKPFGYGKMKLEKLDCELEPNQDGHTCLDLDTLIEKFYKKLYSNAGIEEKEYQNYLQVLVRLASGNNSDRPIRYPRLDNEDPVTKKKKKSEFEIIKSDKKSIRDFTPIK